MSTTRRFTRTGAATLVLAAPIAIAVLIAQPVDGVTSAEPEQLGCHPRGC